MPLPNPTAYRYPNERLILALTLFCVLAVIAFTAAATVCGSVVVVGAMLAFAYVANQMHHEGLIKRAQPVTPETLPGLAALVHECETRLRAGPVRTFVVPANVLNAYTFGLSDPKTVVIYAPLLRMMNADELQFIVGHELGHVSLGHTWMNSLLGGMAGIPSPFGAAVLLHFAFRWWNRACEYSADRAGLLACGNPHSAISALVRLATGTGERDPAAVQLALKHVEAEDDDVANVVGELLATHPLMVRRIEALRRYAASGEYRRLQALV